jgi:hypothetical protein
MNFKIGQKVVCVRVGDYLSMNFFHPSPLKKGEVYTISGVGTINEGESVGISLEEIVHPNGEPAWYLTDRFRPVQEKKTDISVFQKILNDVKQGMKV